MTLSINALYGSSLLLLFEVGNGHEYPNSIVPLLVEYIAPTKEISLLSLLLLILGLDGFQCRQSFLAVPFFEQQASTKKQHIKCWILHHWIVHEQNAGRVNPFRTHGKETPPLLSVMYEECILLWNVIQRVLYHGRLAEV